MLQLGVAVNVREPLPQIRSIFQVVPGTEEMVDRRGQKVRLFYSFQPVEPADLFDRLPIREDSKIPSADTATLF